MNDPLSHSPPAWPRWAYLPGVTAEPDRPPLEQVKASVPPRFARSVLADHAAVRYGVRLHDAGFFWEAHEILEAVWMAAPMNGRDRLALRAFIQIANAGLKRRMGQARAVARLAAEAAAVLDELAGRPPGEDPAGLGEAVEIAGLRAALSRFQDADLDGMDEPAVKIGPFFRS